MGGHRVTKGIRLRNKYRELFTRYTVNGFKLVIIFAFFAKSSAFFAVKILTARFAKDTQSAQGKNVQFATVSSILDVSNPSRHSRNQKRCPK